MAEVIRVELRKGSYQMSGDTLPYETQAVKIAEQLAANGYGKLEDAWDEGLDAGQDRWMDFREFGDKPINPYRRPE